MNEKIRVKEKLAYGLGDAASSMFWKIFSMYLLFFYTDVFGITAATAGTMFLVTKVWDAFFRSCSRTYIRPCLYQMGKVSPIFGLDGFTICHNGHFYIFQTGF